MCIISHIDEECQLALFNFYIFLFFMEMIVLFSLPYSEGLGFKLLMALPLTPQPVGISVLPDKGSVAAAKGSSN